MPNGGSQPTLRYRDAAMDGIVNGGRYVSIHRVENGFLIEMNNEKWIAHDWVSASQRIADYWRGPTIAPGSIVEQSLPRGPSVSPEFTTYHSPSEF